MCHPIKQQWTLNRIGNCIDQMLLLKILIGFTLLTDVVIVILPFPSLHKLQMDLPRKLAVFACFGIGFGCCAMSAVRLGLIFSVGMRSLFCSIEVQLTFSRSYWQPHRHLANNLYAMHF